jgi:hypothetical protein
MSSKRCRREGIYHAELNQGHVEVSQVRLRSRHPATEFKSLADRTLMHVGTTLIRQLLGLKA